MGKWDDLSDEEEESRNKNNKKAKTTDQNQQTANLQEKCVVKLSSPLNIPETNNPPNDFSKAKTANEILENIGSNSFINGCRSVDEYQRISFINQGTYGVVYKALCLKTKDYVALKEIKMTPGSVKVNIN